MTKKEKEQEIKQSTKIPVKEKKTYDESEIIVPMINVNAWKKHMKTISSSNENAYNLINKTLNAHSQLIDRANLTIKSL